MTVPITIGRDRPEIMGALTVGFRLDNDLAAQFKRATESDIAFAVDGHIRASTLPAADRAPLASLLKTGGVQTVSLANGEYVALKRPLTPAAGRRRARAPRQACCCSARAPSGCGSSTPSTPASASSAMIAVLAATILSYAVARTITRPLATITDVMREMSATGDLTRKIALSRAASWEDEDAKLLAATFNTLTDSIARFQREAAQRERLSALGRLSTVIAHEIRNPLMIIKASLRTLASERVSRDEIRQALTDVDEEVARLNRVVNDVLDFARPIRFDYAPADVNALCADAEQATRAGHQDMHVTINTGSGARDRRHRRRAPAHRAREHPGERPPRRRRQPSPSSTRLRAVVDAGHRDRRHTALPELLPHHRSRSRHRREARRSAARVRSVLHDQAHRLRPRPGDRQEHHRGHGRHHLRSTAAPATAPKSASSCRFTRGGAGMSARGGTLLLVDDEQKIRRTLGQALRAEGHDVLEAGSVREAQRTLAERSVDVLIVDNLMPDATGLDLIRELVAATRRDRAPADSDDDGARDDRERHRSDEAGRARLPAEAVRSRRAARRRHGARSSISG